MTGIEAAKAPVDKSDEYLALSVDWRPEGMAITPAYCFVSDRSGSDNGYVELKVEPLTGEVYAVVMVITPLARTDVPVRSSIPVTEGAVRLDLSAWQRERERDVAAALSRFDWESDLAIGESDHGVYLALSSVRPVRWVMAGLAGFGVGAGDELAGVLYDGSRFGGADR